MTQPTYNHAYTIAFSIPNSTHQYGEDVTTKQILSALLRRITDLIDTDSIEEAVGAPYDTYEES
jgi:hypothetical protein